MSDLFHEDVPDSYISEVVRAMKLADWHVFQVLTKRADRMREFLDRHHSDVADAVHMWWGVSVENRQHGLPRVGELRQTPAGVRFLSIEPLLEDLETIDLTGIDWVIVGGESGREARSMHPDWVRSIRDQCKEWRVPFFFKQWGGQNKRATGRTLDGKLHNDFPRAALPLQARPVPTPRTIMDLLKPAKPEATAVLTTKRR